jgi:hypothetical protein
VGVPAKIIGRTDESDPGEEVDTMLRRVSLFGRKPSSITTYASTASNMSAMEEVFSVGSTSDHSIHKVNDHCEMGQSSKVHGQKRKPSDGSKWRVPPKHTSGDEFCPFREYAEMAARGTPSGTVNIIHLAGVLQAEGVPQCDLGLSFYEMDQNGRGYIKIAAFLKDGPDVLSRVCGFSPEKATSIVQQAAASAESS